MKFCRNKLFCWFLVVSLCVAGLYGLGRIYYRTTGGFTEGNIYHELAYDARWDVRSEPIGKQHEKVDSILSQKFYYLSKGCQSYVFRSADGQYVLKFFKYQRFRPQFWLSYLTFIPGIDSYYKNKVDKKKQKLESVFQSWKIAYNDLQPETGVVYIHLNKTNHLDKTILLYDKIDSEHRISADRYEFMLQRKAELLCPTIDRLMAIGDVQEARELLNKLVALIVSEYKRGYADNDHALMQNTGVLDGRPIHIDLGQFVKNERVKDPQVYHQELFNKTWKFRKWLEANHPALAVHLEGLLKDVMGDAVFSSLKPRLNKASMGIISHQEV